MLEAREEDIKKEEMVKERWLKESEISLILQTYDDIFSDFDPRPYSHKALSDDFLLETKKATRDKTEVTELRFMLPKSKRKIDQEPLIKRRLREHFKRHALILEDEIKHTKRTGILMTLTGTLMLLLAASMAKEMGFLLDFLRILLEPAGWFTAWTGLDQVYYTAKDKKPDFDYYKKMMHTEIIFISY